MERTPPPDGQKRAPAWRPLDLALPGAQRRHGGQNGPGELSAPLARHLQQRLEMHSLREPGI
eukprot:8054917-Alexandrium_andersonii.AAC.1